MPSSPFASLRRIGEAAGLAALLLCAGPALAQFTLNYTGGAFDFGDSADVGDGVIGSLTFNGTPVLNQVYTSNDLAGWMLATTGNAGFALSSEQGNVLTAFSIVIDGNGRVSYYNFAAEQHVATCELFCDIGQKAIVVTTNSGQLDSAVIQDPNAWSGADAAYYVPGQWSAVSAVPEPAAALLLLSGAALLPISRRRPGPGRAAALRCGS